VLRSQRTQGYVLIPTVPARPSPRPAGFLWRSNPGSGVVLGVRETGEGQALTENQQIVIVLVGGRLVLVEELGQLSEQDCPGQGLGSGVLRHRPGVCIALGSWVSLPSWVQDLAGRFFALTLGIGGDLIGCIEVRKRQHGSLDLRIRPRRAGRARAPVWNR